MVPVFSCEHPVMFLTISCHIWSGGQEQKAGLADRFYRTSLTCRRLCSMAPSPGIGAVSL